MVELNISKSLVGDEGQIQLNLNESFNDGDIVALYGRSGAGKTSILRIIAGLLTPDSGYISVNGQSWLDIDNGINLSPQKRKVGFVFQDHALFPNMTVRDNLRYALNSKQDITIVRELLDVMELTELANRYPHSLSGGQSQRVALARALVPKPQLLLLDEPLSALDQEMRLRLQDYLLKIHREFQLTTILVSHDISEIYKLSNWVVHIDQGRPVRTGSPQELFLQQRLSGKFQFIGEVLQINSEDVVFVLTIGIDNHVVKVIVDQNTASQLEVGDRVLVVSKAFNPIIQKL